jgi:hypothetical protein
MIPDLARIEIRKSSYSGQNGDSCVGIGFWPPTGEEQGEEPLTVVLDTKNPHGGFLVVGESSWARFLATASRDGFRRA